MLGIGWSDKIRLVLNSTTAEVEVEVGVELAIMYFTNMNSLGVCETIHNVTNEGGGGYLGEIWSPPQIAGTGVSLLWK